MGPCMDIADVAGLRALLDMVACQVEGSDGAVPLRRAPDADGMALPLRLRGGWVDLLYITVDAEGE